VEKTSPAPEISDAYEGHQAWPPEVTEGVARYFLSALGPSPRRCLILGCATGVNDALPLARRLAPGDLALAGDIEPAFLRRLRDRAASEGLFNVDAERIDVTGDLSALGRFDLVSFLFVIHRMKEWEEVIDRVCRLVGPGGSFFISEFVGPDGVIYLSNENGGKGADPVSRLIRRYFELLPERFAPRLRSSSISPALRRIGWSLSPVGHRDFTWKQSVTPAEMIRKIAGRAYAPYFSTHPSAELLSRLAGEFAEEPAAPVRLDETIRIYRFERTRS